MRMQVCAQMDSIAIRSSTGEQRGHADYSVQYTRLAPVVTPHRPQHCANITKLYTQRPSPREMQADLGARSRKSRSAPHSRVCSARLPRPALPALRLSVPVTAGDTREQCAGVGRQDGDVQTSRSKGHPAVYIHRIRRPAVSKRQASRVQ